MLGLPAASALDAGAVAVGRVRASLSAVLAQGQGRLVFVAAAAAAKALVRAGPLHSDECTGDKVKVALRHGMQLVVVYPPREETLKRRIRLPRVYR